MAADLLVLARHARPVVEPGVPSTSWDLGPEGVGGAGRLADRLAGLLDPGALVVTSVEAKAVSTGRIVAEALDLPWQTGHDLHEHVRTSTGFVEDAAAFSALVERFFSSPSAAVFGDESADVAYRRFSAALDALVRVHRGRRLCVVTHGTVLSLFLSRRYGLDAWATWQALGQPAYVVVDRRARAVVEVVRSV